MGYVKERLMSSSNYRYDERSFQEGEGLECGILGCVHVAHWRTASPKDAYEKKNRDKKRKVGNYMFLKATKGHTANAGYICWSNSFSDVEFMSPTCIQEKIESTYLTSYRSVKLNKAKCGLQVFFH
jgi:hypothetical protein